MHTEQVDCVVVGAGVIGLAVARALALQGREVIVLEATGLIGSETSSRNSEVIHAGIYYNPAWLKGRFCVQGKHALYAYLKERGIAHNRCGKLLVATHEDQIGQLHALQKNATALGCDDLTYIDADELAQMEPALAAVAGVLSPSTGVLDVHEYMLSLQGDIEADNGVIAFESPALEVDFANGRIEIIVGGKEPSRLVAKTLINSAGLHAIKLANNYNNFPQHLVPKQYYAKGNYFSLTGKQPFKHLIYPMPEKAGMGVHLTLDLGGRARFGPDVEWVEEIDYSVDEARGEKFYAAIRRYWPDLADDALQPGYCGIRPKIKPNADGQQDFLIQGPKDHGVDGLVNLFGMESPGLTGSLAIGDYVVELLQASN